MSGEKDHIVNIRQSEYNRMMGTCSRVDNLEDKVQTINRQHQQEIKEIEQRRQQDLRRFDSQLGNMSVEMRRIEAEQNEKLRRQAEEFFDALDEQRVDLLDEINRQSAELRVEMEQQRSHLQGQLDKIYEKEQDQRKMAETWLNDVEILLGEIDSKYRHAKFRPGRMNDLKGKLSIGNGNFNKEIYQAAISSAQGIFLEANHLRNDVQNLELEWNAYLEQARKSLREVLSVCEAQETCRFSIETETGMVETEVKMDAWTCGGLTKLKNEVQIEVDRLKNPESLTTPQLKEIVRKIEGLREQCLGLGDIAKQALVASQLRQTIADNILKALESSGWRLSDSAYEGEDFTDAFHLKLDNGIGEEIVAIITPEAADDNTIRNHLKVSFFDPNTNNEKTREASLKNIRANLEDSGLECSAPKCKPGTENTPCQDKSRLDFNRVRTRKTAAAQPQS